MQSVQLLRGTGLLLGSKKLRKPKKKLSVRKTGNSTAALGGDAPPPSAVPPVVAGGSARSPHPHASQTDSVGASTPPPVREHTGWESNRPRGEGVPAVGLEPPVISTPLLASRVSRLFERAAVVERRLESIADETKGLRQHDATAKQRLAALEAASSDTASRVNEALLMASDVARKYLSVEGLTGHMEAQWKQIQDSQLALRDAVGAVKRDLEEERKENAKWKLLVQELQQEVKLLQTALKNTSHTDGVSDVNQEGGHYSATGPSLSGLESKVRLLIHERIVLQRVQDHLRSNAAKSAGIKVQDALDAVESVAEACTRSIPQYSGSNVVVSIPDDGCVAHAQLLSPAVAAPADVIASILCGTSLLPFRDAQGATRLCSQRVLVRGVPVSAGAGEVRAVFARVGMVISCVVRRLTAKPQGNLCGGVGVRVSRSSGSPSQKPDQRYVSQLIAEGKPVELPTAGTAAAATVGRERAFEVVYENTEEALRAVSELHGELMWSFNESSRIQVEPIVSTDIIAALEIAAAGSAPLPC